MSFSPLPNCQMGTKLRGNQTKARRLRRATRRSHTLPQRMSAMTAHVENHAAKTAQASTAQASKALHDVAQKSTAQAKENYEKMSAPAAAAADLMKIAYSTTFKGAQDYSAKVIEFAHVNTNAAFEYARQLS